MAMIDPLAKMRALLLAQSAISALVSTRVYCEVLPEGWERGSQDCDKAITIKLGEANLDKNSPRADVPFSLFCWGESTIDAMSVARAVVDSLHAQYDLTADGTRWMFILVTQFGPSDVLEELGWKYVEVGLETQLAVR